MRDYVQLFYTKDSQPWLPTVVTQFYFFESAEKCQAFVDANPVSPGGGTLSAVQPIWFRLNKDIVLGYINQANVTNIGDGGTPVLDGTGKQMIWLGESPRNEGINSRDELMAGKSSAATAKKGNFSGAQGLVDALAGLLIYVQALKSQGRLRDAGIVQFAYDQVTSGKWSITQAFDYLRENNLV